MERRTSQYLPALGDLVEDLRDADGDCRTGCLGSPFRVDTVQYPRAFVSGPHHVIVAGPPVLYIFSRLIRNHRRVEFRHTCIRFCEGLDLVVAGHPALSVNFR